MKKISGGDFGKINLEKVSKELDIIDRWVMNYYKILPTDMRYKKLSEEVKEILFYSFVHTPTESTELLEVKENLRKRDVPEPDESVYGAAEDMGIDLEKALEAIRSGGE